MDQGCVSAAVAGGRLTIDLKALVANYRLIERRTAPTRVAAVVKADAYGLGARRVAAALAVGGCRDFFVAELGEALALKPALPADARLYVLNGLGPGAEPACADAGIFPVLNCLDQALRWRDLAKARAGALPAALQIDSGMSRLGLSPDEVAWLAGDRDFFRQVDLRLVMSHLASADVPGAPSNDEQRLRFAALAALLPPTPRSLANSAACLSDPAAHGDLVRPGLALYGASPLHDGPNPMSPVVRLDARVIQVRDLPAGAGVGYGLTYRAPGARRIATIAAGYADGWPRSLSNRGAVFHDGVMLPIVGRISMDSMTVDATVLRPEDLRPGDLVELIGPHQSLEEVAALAGTISYEILTNLGPRYARLYLEPAAPISEEGRV